MKDLIFETLILEATARVSKLARKGTTLEEAIQRVAEDMELDGPETAELKVRAKKAPKPKMVEDDLDAAMDELSKDDKEEESSSNSIIFNTPEELETAVGVLMYKGIPWVSKSEKSVEFQTAEEVQKAKDALNRRWEFIADQPRVVATIDFDNLEDYSKVLDFIASKRMGVIMGDADDLATDLDVQIAEAQAQYKKAKKEAKASGQPAPEAPSEDMSFKALHKDSLVDPAALDVLADDKSRAIHVVKRWK